MKTGNYKNKTQQEYYKEYYFKNKEKRMAQNKQWQKDNRQKHNQSLKKYDLKRLYGITVADRNRMYKDQNGKCAICGVLQSESRKLHIDHNHTTGKVRGLLCWGCNSGLGKFNDNVELLEKAIEYLNKYKNVAGDCIKLQADN